MSRKTSELSAVNRITYTLRSNAISREELQNAFVQPRVLQPEWIESFINMVHTDIHQLNLITFLQQILPFLDCRRDLFQADLFLGENCAISCILVQ